MQKSIRILCFQDEGTLVVLTNAFVKKTQKTPKKEIKLAENLKIEYLKQKEDDSFKAQLARIMHATSATNDADLARALGISQPSVWGVKNKGKIPDSWIKKVANKYAVSTDWLYKGGPDYKNILYKVSKTNY